MSPNEMKLRWLYLGEGMQNLVDSNWSAGGKQNGSLIQMCA